MNARLCRTIATLLLAADLAACTAPPTQTAASPAPPTVDALVASTNQEFRNRYAETRGHLLDNTSPVVIVNFSELILHRQGRPDWRRNFRSPIYEEYKTVAHVPLGLYMLATRYADGPPSDELRREAVAYRAKVSALAAAVDRLHVPASEWPRQREILNAAIAVFDRLAADGTIPRRDLEAFTRRMGPLQLINADLASADELDRLHEATNELRAQLAPGEWDKTYVLVNGAKMPRVGNLQYEYFVRVMGRREIEHRLLYTEGLMTPDTALQLLGTVVNDRPAAEAFFNDRYRLDRDLLADGVTKHLNAMFGPAR